MTENPYERFNDIEMILRDYLAMDRTVLANERTFLAYIRTAFAFILGGVTFIKFFNELQYLIIGWVFIPVGIVCFVIGLTRYSQIRQRIMKANQ